MKNKGNIILSVIGVVLSIALLVVSTILAEKNYKYCDCSCSYSGFGGFGLDCDFLRRKG